MTQQTTCRKGHLIYKNTCDQCESLRKKWYKELKETGFQDIENINGIIKTWATDIKYKKDSKTQEIYQAKETYFEWAREIMCHASFKTEVDQRIWHQYSEGRSHRDVARQVGLEHSWVTRKINKIKDYLSNQTIASMSMSLSTV